MAINPTQPLEDEQGLGHFLTLEYHSMKLMTQDKFPLGKQRTIELVQHAYFN